MDSARVGLSRTLYRCALGFTGLLALGALSSDPAAARYRHHHHYHHHHHRHADGHRYHRAPSGDEPAYADIVVDANSGKALHESNPDSLRHPASLTKIMTLYLLFEQLEVGKLKLDTEMQVSAHASSQPPTKLGLRPGETIEVEDAIKAIVTQSANDMAVVVAEAIGGDEDTFARLMTRKAHVLGMTRTVYVNASGLPANEQLTTARDQALLGRAIQERFPTYYKYFATLSFHYHGMSMRNHNHLLGSMAGVDGIKTGYTQSSGFNLVTSVRRGNRHIVAVVLGGASGGSRDARMRELIDDNIEEAATTRTAPVIADAADAATMRPKARSAATDPASRGAAAEAAPAVPRPAPGSAEPIHPIPVKTIAVKPGVIQTAALGPLVTAAPQAGLASTQWSARGQPPAAVPQVTADATPPAPPPPARPGILGTLPIRTAAVDAPDAAPPGLPAARPASAASLVARAAVAAETETTAAVPAVDPVLPQRARPRGEWMIQVGAFEEEGQAKEALKSAQSMAQTVLGNADPYTERVMKGPKELYRARFAGFDKDGAEAACHYFKRNDIACMALKN